ncbi:MAG: nuclease [Verrucomicrobiaceae bacterium]|nr:nuclease [Verrucomicrobiaceae bacterium]
MKPFFAFLFILAACRFSCAGEPSKAPEPEYVYHAEMVRVIDGSTLVMNVDLGFHVWLHDETLRLEGITAPDPRGDQKAEAQKWRQALTDLIEGHKLTIKTRKDKSPNPPTRFLVTLWADDENVNEALPKAVK